jgi:hypothetical protein
MIRKLTIFISTDISGVQYRRSRPASRTGSVIESKSPGFINTRLVNYNRGVSYQPSMHSHSQYHPEPENIPPPSTNEEKTKQTKRYFATIFAISYAIFLVIFGAIAFIGDAVEKQHPIPEVNISNSYRFIPKTLFIFKDILPLHAHGWLLLLYRFVHRHSTAYSKSKESVQGKRGSHENVRGTIGPDRGDLCLTSCIELHNLIIVLSNRRIFKIH